ncbi:hypothetical protein [Pseudonocardia sp. T1-2H]|uniref:hypothetical protein n=1 Tax=Pseudonocardia sp. T1-2H TaxID=3128899 RepID=UPI0031010662
MGLSWYNGHSPAQREAVQRYLNQQWASGDPAWPRPSLCAACAQTQGAIHGHLENYDRPETYVPLCITCHLVLHCRFRHRAIWAEYQRRIAEGWQPPPLNQREAFGRIRAGILAGLWPDGLWRPETTNRTYLDTLSMTRVPAG